MRVKFLLLSGLLLCGVISLFAREEIELKDPKAVYQHSVTQFAWPPVVGAFEREAIFRYDEKGLDIGVTYRHDSGAWVDVYFYPNPDLDLKKHFQECCEAITRYPEAKQVKLRFTMQIKGKNKGKERGGWHAEYLLPKGMKGTDSSKNTELYLFPVGKAWFLKFRATYPSDARAFSLYIVA